MDGIVREREVTAPFSGNLAYRAASPKTVRPRGTLMVLAPENGFRLTARMSHSDADALREGAEVVIELGEDSPERRIPARFRKTESLAHEPGYAALQLECQPPPETVRRLAEGEKLTVSFTWHPPLIDLWSFRVGVLLVVGGLIGLLMKGRLGARGQIQTGNWPEGVVVVVPNVRAGEQLEVHALEAPHDSPEWCRGGKPHYAEHLAVANRSPNWLGVAKLLARLRSLRRPVREPARSDRFHHLRQTLDAQASMPHNSLPRLTSARS